MRVTDVYLIWIKW